MKRRRCDGATSTGDFHVSCNFAQVHKAPCMLFLRNKGVLVDGNDVLALIHVTAEAAARARAGEEPTLIEALTCRRGAHTSSDDPSVYRESAEPKEWEASDPIKRMRAYCEAKGIWSESEKATLRKDFDLRFATLVKDAEAVPSRPPLASLFDDVYEARPWHIEEQARELEAKARRHGERPARA